MAKTERPTIKEAMDTKIVANAIDSSPEALSLLPDEALDRLQELYMIAAQEHPDIFDISEE